MSTLIRSITIIDASSVHHLQKRDVRIDSSGIAEIGNDLQLGSSAEVLADGKYLFKGLCELHADFSDPGYEHREDLNSGAQAALVGGFTRVLTTPDTSPVIDNRSAVEYIRNKQNALPIHIYPVGSLTQDRKGLVISEMYDMKKSGAVAFSDDKYGEVESGVLRLALQYSGDFSAPIMVFPFDRPLAFSGVVHEGAVSTRLGLKGIPAVSEVTAVEKSLRIAEYCGVPIHLSYISTGESVEVIRSAKARGVHVTCDVSMNNIIYNDEVLEYFDTRYKVLPPIRSEWHRNALVDGLKDGTIDALTCDHRPRDIESKKREFDLADFGSIGLSTAIAELQRVLDIELIVEKFSFARKWLNLPNAPIEKGYSEDFVVYNPDESYFADKSFLPSKSLNTPILNAELTGKVELVYCKSEVVLNRISS